MAKSTDKLVNQDATFGYKQQEVIQTSRLNGDMYRNGGQLEQLRGKFHFSCPKTASCWENK